MYRIMKKYTDDEGRLTGFNSIGIEKMVFHHEERAIENCKKLNAENNIEGLQYVVFEE